MRIPGGKRLIRAGRWLRSRIISGALILGYHRIVETEHDPYSICVSPRHFAEQLEALREHANPIRLAEIILRLQDGNLPPRSVAITFDDGYKDHLYQAKLLLERYQIPATVFITTGYLGREFWWNELEGILKTPVRLPDRLCLTISGKSFDWASDHYRRPNPNPARVRQELLLSLYDYVLRLTAEEQQNILAELREWTGARASHTKPSSALNAEEVLQLASGGMIEIGAHSVTHPFLGALPPTAQRFEIQESKAYLEELLGHPLAGFSYPNGAASKKTRAIVREAGFTFACASYNDMTWRGSDRFYLPRFWATDCDGQTFSRWLLRWLT